ncbi:MAG: hypothetical protein KC503_34285 [Myxococcales bacterium]|nr:hypothetical protein [Myxococcales bacterium]
MMPLRFSLLLAAALAGLLGGCPKRKPHLTSGTALGSARKAVRDCSDPSCREIAIAGDAPPKLAGKPAPLRGYGDPSLTVGPDGKTLVLSYTLVSYHPRAAKSAGEITDGALSIHVATSDDAGATFRFRRAARDASAGNDPAGRAGAGYWAHEVSTITHHRGHWWLAWFSYFDPRGKAERTGDSMHLRLARADTLEGLGKAPAEEAVIAGPLLHASLGRTVDVSALDESLSRCKVFTEPALFSTQGTLYLALQCIVVDFASGKPRRQPQRELIALLASDGSKSPKQLQWRYVGALTRASLAKKLGTEVLTQPELTRDARGGFLLLVTGKNLASKRHEGCYALRIEKLDPPRVNATPLAYIQSSNASGPLSGQCSYDAASALGLLFVRHEQPGIFTLHASGLRL